MIGFSHSSFDVMTLNIFVFHSRTVSLTLLCREPIRMPFLNNGLASQRGYSRTTFSCIQSFTMTKTSDVIYLWTLLSQNKHIAYDFKLLSLSFIDLRHCCKSWMAAFGYIWIILTDNVNKSKEIWFTPESGCLNGDFWYHMVHLRCTKPKMQSFILITNFSILDCFDVNVFLTLVFVLNTLS